MAPLILVPNYMSVHKKRELMLSALNKNRTVRGAHRTKYHVYDDANATETMYGETTLERVRSTINTLSLLDTHYHTL